MLTRAHNLSVPPFYTDIYSAFNLEIPIFLKVEFYRLLIKKNDHTTGELVDNFRFGKECSRFPTKFLFRHCYGLAFLQTVQCFYKIYFTLTYPIVILKSTKDPV